MINTAGYVMGLTFIISHVGHLNLEVMGDNNLTMLRFKQSPAPNSSAFQVLIGVSSLEGASCQMNLLSLDFAAPYNSSATKER